MVLCFLGLPLGIGANCRNFVSERNPHQLWNLYRLIPNSLLSWFCVSPAANRSRTWFFTHSGYCVIPFLPDMQLPPDVVMILHQGAFCLLSVFTGSVQYSAAFITKLQWNSIGVFSQSKTFSCFFCGIPVFQAMRFSLHPVLCVPPQSISGTQYLLRSQP